jgi:hypothetical protein
MPFVIKPTRKHEFTYEEDGDQLVAVFDFVCSEDGIPKSIRDKIVFPKKDEEGNIIDSGNTADVIWYNIRRSLKEVRGLIDADTGENITFIESDGSINEDKQKSVFEFLIGLSMGPQFMDAYLGIDSKNSKAGATQLSTGSGEPTADRASEVTDTPASN